MVDQFVSIMLTIRAVAGHEAGAAVAIAPVVVAVATTTKATGTVKVVVGHPTRPEMVTVDSATTVAMRTSKDTVTAAGTDMPNTGKTTGELNKITKTPPTAAGECPQSVHPKSC